MSINFKSSKCTSSSQQCTAIFGTCCRWPADQAARLVGKICGQQVLDAQSCHPSNCLLLAVVPFQLPQLKSGTCLLVTIVVIIVDFPSLFKNSSFLIVIPSTDF